MKLSDVDRQKLEELAGDDGIPKWIVSENGDVDLNKLQRWISSRIDEAATNITDEDFQRWEAERIQKIAKLKELIIESKERDEEEYDYNIPTDEERAARRAEDEAAYEEMLADEIDVFDWVENSLPRDVASMIAETLVPNTLLKEEIALLKTEEGRNYMFSRMYGVAKTRKALMDGNSSVRRCVPKWRKCECY